MTVQFMHPAVENGDLTTGGGVEGAYDVEQRCLARSGRADQTGKLPRCNCEIDVTQSHEVAAAQRIETTDSFDLNN